MEFNAKKIKVIMLAISFMITSGLFVASFQEQILKAKANVSSIIIYLDHLDFGRVFPGEQLQKTFTVHYSGSGNGDYNIVEKYKPLPGATVPEGYSGNISDYCQDNFNDFDRCYKTLCPFIEEFSEENEGDTVLKASVSSNDLEDLWIVAFNNDFVPAIIGNVSQDHKGDIISESGIYGCDLSFNVDVEYYCGDGILDDGEECDDGPNGSDTCTPECTLIKGSISGCKYNDLNSDGVIDAGEEKLFGWEIQLIGCPYLSGGSLSFPFKDGIGSGLPGACVVIETTTTVDGCYSFDGLNAGDYGVNEVDKDNWTQTYPVYNTFYFFPLGIDEDKINIDFANFTEQGPYCGDGSLDTGEECDDGNNIDGDGCSAVCKTEQDPYCGDGNLDSGEQCDDGNNVNGDGCSAACNTEGGGGGGGGGTVLVSLQINNAEECVVTEDGTYFSWKTNMTSSSRVVCDTEPNPAWGTPPDYGYFLYTDEHNLSPRVLDHEVKIPGLVPGENYYCRVISSSSSSTVFEEVICSVPEEEEEGEVKGEVDVIIPEALPKTGYGGRI